MPLFIHLIETATSSVHGNHSEFYCSQISQLIVYMHTNTVMQPIRSYQYHIHNTPTQCLRISTSGMLAHILTDCSRRTGEGQGEEEEEDTEEG